MFCQWRKAGFVAKQSWCVRVEGVCVVARSLKVCSRTQPLSLLSVFPQQKSCCAPPQCSRGPIRVEVSQLTGVLSLSVPDKRQLQSPIQQHTAARHNGFTCGTRGRCWQHRPGVFGFFSRFFFFFTTLSASCLLLFVCVFHLPPLPSHNPHKEQAFQLCPGCSATTAR